MEKVGDDDDDDDDEDQNEEEEEEEEEEEDREVRGLEQRRRAILLEIWSFRFGVWISLNTSSHCVSKSVTVYSPPSDR
jgi:hypothetical protein